MLRPVDAVRVDPLAYGRALKRTLWTDEALKLLPGGGRLYGWNNGGCLLLADALVLVLGDAVQPMAVLSGAGRVGQHFLVRSRARVCGDWYLDGDGAARHATLLRRWESVEQVLYPRLVPAEAAVVSTQTPRDAGVSARIADYIRARVTVPDTSN